MTYPKLFIPIVILVLSLIQPVFSQTGPGGVGNATGASGQPHNVLWLKSDAGITHSSGFVDSWTDQSGNGNNAIGTGATRPSFTASDGNFNNLPSITFPATAASNFYLEVPDNDNLDNTTQLTVFFVVRPTTTPTTLGILSKRTAASVNQSYFFDITTAERYRVVLATSAAANLVGANSTLSQKDIVSFIMNGATKTGYLDGANSTSPTGSNSIPNTSSNLYIGSYQPSDNNGLEGELVEVIIFRSTLNDAQRVIIENYLSAKYNSSITGDLYAGDISGGSTLDHDFDLAGIGQSGVTQHFLGNSRGVILAPSGGTIDSNNEFLLAAHNGVSNSAVATNLGTGGVVQRWNRTWYFDETGVFDATISFDFSEGISGQFPQNKDNYVLLKRNTGTGNYDVVPIANANKTIVGDQISFQVADADLTDGVYTLGTLDLTNSPVVGVSNRTWYSYLSGNWNDPNSWTLDGGITPLLVNPSSEIPGLTDNVIITSGKTITMNVNNVQVNSLQVTGTLDVAATTGHNFVTITGSGKIKLSGASDNFPAGNATDFADNSIGGTLELNGGSISLNANRTFNNLEINLVNPSDIATLLSDYTLNGNLSILNGQFRFNDATIANRNLTVYGDVLISSSGSIRVGATASSTRHEFNLYGDFTNDGTAYFTQRTDDSQRNAAEATDGIVDFNTLNSSQDQQIVCNGETRFYRIEINKGTDETYKTSINASVTTNFGLFGKANYDINTATGANDNATGLRNGTLEVGNNVLIPHLNTTGNYAIFETAQLWVNGGSVTKSGGTAIVPYGRLRVTTGALTALIGSGITTRENGIIQIEGGTVNLGAIRTSVAGAGAVGSYIQSGGTVTVTGTGGISADYAVFSLTYTGNVFNMSGGTLTIRNRPTDNGTGSLRGTIFINSDPANVSVTGGSIIAEINSTVPYIITSRAPFWNLTLRNTLDAILRDIELLGSTSGTGGGASEPSVAAQNLVVKGGLTIDSYARLDHNGRNLNIAGNLTINANGDLIYDGSGGGGRRNTTTLDGTDNAALSFLNRNDGNGEQRFWNLIINKPSDKVVSLASSKTNLAGSNNNLLRIDGNAFKLLSGTLDQGFHSVRMYCDTVLNYQTLGVYNGAATDDGTVANDRNDMIKLRDDNTPTTLLTTNSSVFGVVRLNSGDDPIALRSNVYIKFLQYLYGKINLGTFNLKIDQVVGDLTNPSQLPPRGTQADSLGLQTRAFSVEDMLVTNGAASDGGLSLRISGNGIYKFPLGLGVTADDNTDNPGTDIYTPAQVTVSGFSDDGYITINTVNSTLQTTNLAGGTDILNYYWRVRYEGFTTLPTVKYQFTYNQSDVGGTETNYVPGKVLDISPFTRSSEAASVNTTKNIIHFDGTGTGFTLEQANYTAGASTRFTGAPVVYYSRVNSGNWNVNSTWSLTRGGAAAASVPGPGDIVIMRRTGVTYSGVVTIPSGYTANAAQVLFDDENGFSSGCPRIIFQTGTPFSSNLGTIEVAATHQGGALSGDIHGAVLQYNVDNTYSGIFPSGDFGGFNNYLNALVIYEWQSGTGTITLSSAATEYPQLWFQNGSASRIIKFPNVDVTVKGRAYITGSNQVMANDGASSVTLNFQRNLEIGSGCCGGGTFLFPGTAGANQTVQVDGNILYSTTGTRSIQILTPATATPRAHKLIAKGNISVVTGTTLNLGSGSASETNVVLELQGETNNTFTNTGTVTLSRIVMNKGTSNSNTFSFDDAFTLTGATNTATKAIELQNGLLILNDAAINVTLSSGGGNFNIPSSAGLEVRLGNARTTTTSTDASILLDGLLRVSGGTVDINGGGATDTNFIEYSNSGNAAIEVTSGTLTVAGKIRRALTSLTGVLRYTQSGGTVIIANESGTGSDDRGVFEVVNTGSQFNHSGGAFTIVQGINSTTIPSVLIEPASATITSGSTITIGNGSTPAGANSQNIGIKSTVSLNNLAIAGVNNPVVKIYVSPLTIGNDLTVSAGTTLNANNQNLTIGGNFTVNGSYVPTSNTTSFTNAGAAAISGSTPLFNFFSFTKSGAGVLTVSKDITVNQDLSVLAGTLATSSFAINLKRNALIDASITSTTGSGLIFNGSAQQQLTRTLSGTSSIGILTINNTSGVIIPDGNGYNYNLSGGLRLQQGVFDIGGSLLFLETNAVVTPVSPFSVTNMIQTNSSFTDFGVRKQFPLNYATDFTFPVGQLLYTPVTFKFSGVGQTTGTTLTPTITVRPANERHPTIVNDSENPDLEIDDLQNVLQYHWIINADNVSNTFVSAMTLTYDQTLVSLTPPNLETEYIPARILSDGNPSGNINKFSVADVDATNNVLTFTFTSVGDALISGEYFAGIDNAIPNTVPTYTVISDGNADQAIYSPVVPSGGVPSGAQVIVPSGRTLTFDATNDNISFYKLDIESGATLNIRSGSIGNRLGILSGQGNIRLEGPTIVLPAAVYDDFFSCSGGGLIYGGTGFYEILGGINSLRNLTIEGAGSRTLGSNDISICNNLVIANATFNTNGKNISVGNDLHLNSGAYSNTSGNLVVSNDFNQSGGSFNGGFGGSKTIARDLIVSGGTFTAGFAPGNNYLIGRNMTVDGAATFTGGTASASGVRFIFQGSTQQTITGDFSGSRAFNRLETSNAAGLRLAGNVTVNSELLLTTGNITPGSNTFLLALGAVATPTEGKATSFVDGKLYKALGAGGAPTSANTFTFPIGSGSLWRSGSVSVASGTAATWDMQYIALNADAAEASVTNMTPIAPIVTLASGEYWKVSDGNVAATGRTATVGLSWGIESDVNASSVERQDLRVMQWVGAPTNQWQNRGGTNFSGGNTQSRGTFNASSTISFSEQIVTLGSVDASNPLPVELLSFVGVNQNGFNKLEWKTASELNNDFFELQRSSTGEEFTAIGKMQGKGTTNDLSAYTYMDEQPFIGKNYYRLKQVDFNGNFEYSNIILVTNDTEDVFNISVFPNPASKEASITIRTMKGDEYEATVHITDMTGRTLTTYAIYGEGSFEQKVDVSTWGEVGIYLVEMRQGSKRVFKRLMLN